MALPKTKKREIVDFLKENFQKKKIAIFVGIEKIDSSLLFDLRKKLREGKSLMKVAKKTLIEKALEKIENKEIIERLKEFQESFATVFGLEDEISAPKICYDFSKENKNLKILGGILNGKFLTKEEIIELAKLPSKQELVGQFFFILNFPMRGFLQVIKANLNKFLFLLEKIKVKKLQNC